MILNVVCILLYLLNLAEPFKIVKMGRENNNEQGEKNVKSKKKTNSSSFLIDVRIAHWLTVSLLIEHCWAEIALYAGK